MAAARASSSSSSSSSSDLVIRYSESSGSTTFSDLPRAFTPPPAEDEGQEEVDPAVHRALHEVFFALGEEKWREAVDIGEHRYGKMVYDECLHRGNGKKKERGFLQSSLNAFEYVGGLLGTKTTLEQWLECHRIMCAHFVDYRTTGTDHHDIQGKLRVHYWINYANYSADAVTKEAVVYLSALRPKIAEFRKSRRAGGGWGSDPYATVPECTSTAISSFNSTGGFRLVFSKMKRKRRVRYFDYYRDEMYHSLRHATSDEEKLRAIVRFHQVCQWLHLAMDGTQRVCMVFLNKHLTEAGFHPVLLPHPHYADITSLDQWTAVTQHGLRAWERQLKSQGGKWPLHAQVKKGKKPRIWDDKEPRPSKNKKKDKKKYKYSS